MSKVCLYIDAMKATTTTTPKRAQYNTRGASKMVSYRMPLSAIELIARHAKQRNSTKVQVIIDAINQLES